MNHQKTEALTFSRALVCLGALLAAACGGGDQNGSGSVVVLLEAEDVVIGGLEAGDDLENIQDGWSVDFDKYIVTIGDIDLHSSTDGSEKAGAAESFVVDLTEVPASGLQLWSLDGLAEGSWEVHYSTLGAGEGAERHESVGGDDFDLMVESDFTYWIEGTMTHDAGQSCPPADLAEPGDATPNGRMSGDNDCYDVDEIGFVFGAEAETLYGPCEIDGVAGVAVSADSTTTVALTIHGDHLLFNGFPEGGEGGVTRLAQWLADCDLDLDGTVTQEELESIATSDLPEIDDRFQLGGSPITPLRNMYEYLTAQLKTQGHFQGEGECPLDGALHDHD